MQTVNDELRHVKTGESGFTATPVKLFIGMFSSEVLLFEKIKDILEGTYGPVELESPLWPWDHTDYYAEEMGQGLKRKFIFFEQLIHPGIMADVKLIAVDLERDFLNEKGGRRVNIDPGYLDAARVALVSTDDYAHRVYIGKGIYGEITLVFSGGEYRILPSTYPDFQKSAYHDLFKKARRLYQAAMKRRM